MDRRRSRGRECSHHACPGRDLGVRDHEVLVHEKADGQTVTVTVRNDRAEDALSAPGFTCTGD